uniref:Uncharacterized protein n=1 Tax=Cryptophlebia leucotreta granulosis virus TaxID=35254 RepID=A0A2H4ZKH6_GVCL|nr:hypothetical protein [Cryptophlebia leucotreta granulovirus]
MYQTVVDLIYLNGEYEIWKSSLTVDYRNVVKQRILAFVNADIANINLDRVTNQDKTCNPKLIGMRTAYNYVLSLINNQTIFDEFQRLMKTEYNNYALLDACLFQMDEQDQEQFVFCLEEEIKKIKNCINQN